jgi:hypothetical protein
MADENQPTTKSVAASKGAADTQPADKKEERRIIDASDVTTPRALQIFQTFGSKGAMQFTVGMEVTESDIDDYFPSREAYARRVQRNFIGVPTVR